MYRCSVYSFMAVSIYYTGNICEGTRAAVANSYTDAINNDINKHARGMSHCRMPYLSPYHAGYLDGLTRSICRSWVVAKHLSPSWSHFIDEARDFRRTCLVESTYSLVSLTCLVAADGGGNVAWLFAQRERELRTKDLGLGLSSEAASQASLCVVSVLLAISLSPPALPAIRLNKQENALVLFLPNPIYLNPASNPVRTPTPCTDTRTLLWSPSPIRLVMT